MELPSKVSEEPAFITRPKIEKHMLIVMDKRTHEEHLDQPLQTSNKQLRIAVTFLMGYNGIFNVKIQIKKFYFAKSITEEDGFFQITIHPAAYEIESLNNEIERIIIEESHFTEVDYPFTTKAIFSLLGSIIEVQVKDH